MEESRVTAFELHGVGSAAIEVPVKTSNAALGAIAASKQWPTLPGQENLLNPVSQRPSGARQAPSRVPLQDLTASILRPSPVSASPDSPSRERSGGRTCPDLDASSHANNRSLVAEGKGTKRTRPARSKQEPRGQLSYETSGNCQAKCCGSPTTPYKDDYVTASTTGNGLPEQSVRRGRRRPPKVAKSLGRCRTGNAPPVQQPPSHQEPAPLERVTTRSYPQRPPNDASAPISESPHSNAAALERRNLQRIAAAAHRSALPRPAAVCQAECLQSPASGCNVQRATVDSRSCVPLPQLQLPGPSLKDHLYAMRASAAQHPQAPARQTAMQLGARRLLSLRSQQFTGFVFGIGIFKA